MKSIYIYKSEEVDSEEIYYWIKNRVGEKVKLKGEFLKKYKDESLPKDFAEARVFSPYDKKTGSNLEGIIRYEKRVLENPEMEGGVLYDGIKIQRKLNSRVPKERLSSLHIILFKRAIATWGKDGRWHKRVSILGQPSIISIPGLYEAPAKPKEYYKLKKKHALTGGTPPREILEENTEGTFLIKDDPRTAEAIKGYVLQAIDFWKTGDPFCENSNCRLYNAHKQENVIKAQLNDPEFCEKHKELYG